MMGFFDFLKSKPKNNNKVVARNPLNLQVGDIVEYDLAEYKVIGKLIYEEGGYLWYDYHLFDGQKHLWLGAEDDDELEIGLYKKLDVNHQLYVQLQNETPKKLTYEGKEYTLIEGGKANIRAEGRVGAKTGQRVQYWDYEASNGSEISVERWGNELEISIGQEVKESLLEYYPGVSNE